MAKLSLFRGNSTAVTGRTVTDGQVLVDLTNHSLYTDVGNTRISLSSSSEREQSDWAESDTSSASYIRNKPTKLNQFNSTLVVTESQEPVSGNVDNKTRWVGGDDGRVDLTFLNMDGSEYMVIRRNPGDTFPTVKTPVLSTRIFDHWSPSLPSTVPNADATYVAIPKSQITLTFLGHGGTTYETIQAYPGDNFPTIQNPTYTNSRFLGWDTEFPAKVPLENTTYTSSWLDAILLTFLGHGGSTYQEIYAYPGDTFPTIADPTYTDSRFLGWNTTFPSTVPDEDTTYTSSWLDAVTLTFLGHGGSTYTTKKGFPGDSFPSITNPTYTNSRFKGWSPSLPSKIPNSSTTYTSTWLDAVKIDIYAYLIYGASLGITDRGISLLSGYYYPGDNFPSYTCPYSVSKKGGDGEMHNFYRYDWLTGKYDSFTFAGEPPTKVPSTSKQYGREYA